MSEPKGEKKPRFSRLKVLISVVSITVGLAAVITRVPRFFIDLEEWSGIRLDVGEYIDVPATRDDQAPRETPEERAEEQKEAKAELDAELRLVLEVNGKQHPFLYGSGVERAPRLEVKQATKDLWAVLRPQALELGIPFNDTLKLRVLQFADENADRRLALDELQRAKQAGLIAILHED